MPDPENEYLRNTHSALTKKVGGFNKTYEEFSSSMADESYAKNVHNALTKKVGGFTKTYESTGLKKKVPTTGSVESQDLSQGVPGGTLTEELAGSTSELAPSTSASQGNGIDAAIAQIPDWMKPKQPQEAAPQVPIQQTQEPVVPVSELGETLPPVTEGTPPEITGPTRTEAQAAMGTTPFNEGFTRQGYKDYDKRVRDESTRKEKTILPRWMGIDIDPKTGKLIKQDEGSGLVNHISFDIAAEGDAEVSDMDEGKAGIAPSRILDEVNLGTEGTQGTIDRGILDEQIKISRGIIANERKQESLETSLTKEDQGVIIDQSKKYEEKYFQNIDDLDKFASKASVDMEEFKESLPEDMSDFNKERIVNGVSLRVQGRYEERKKEVERDQRITYLKDKAGIKDNIEQGVRNLAISEFEGGVPKYKNLTEEESLELSQFLNDQQVSREGYVIENRAKNMFGPDRFAKTLDDAASQLYSPEEIIEKGLVKKLNDLYDSKADQLLINEAESALETHRGFKVDGIWDPVTKKRIGMEEAPPSLVKWDKRIKEDAVKLSRTNTEEDLKNIQSRAWSEIKYLESTGLEDSPELQSKKDEFEAASRALDFNKSITNIERNAWTRVVESATEGIGFDFNSDEDDVFAYQQMMSNNGLGLTDAEKDRVEQRFVDKLGNTVGGSVPVMMEIMFWTAATGGAGVTAAIERNVAKFAVKFATGEKSAKALNGIARVVSNATNREMQFQLAGESGGAGESLGAEAATSLAGNLAFLGNSIVGRVLRTGFTQAGRATGETIEEYSGELWSELMKNKSWSDAMGTVIGDDPLEKLALTYITGAIFAVGKVGSDFKGSKVAQEMGDVLLDYDGDNEIVNEAKKTAEALNGVKPGTQLEIDFEEKEAGKKEFKAEDSLGKEGDDREGNIVNIKEVEGELSNYAVDGKVRSDKQVIENLSDPEFVEKVKSGKANLDIQNPSPKVKTALEESGLLETKQDVKEKITPETKVDETPIKGEQQVTESVEAKKAEIEKREKQYKDTQDNVDRNYQEENWTEEEKKWNQKAGDQIISGYVIDLDRKQDLRTDKSKKGVRVITNVVKKGTSKTKQKVDIAEFDSQEAADTWVKEKAEKIKNSHQKNLDKIDAKQDAKIKETKVDETKVEETKVLEAKKAPQGTTNLTQAISDSKIGKAGILTNDQKVFNAIKEVSKDVSEETGLVGQKLINEVAKRVNETSEGKISTEDVVDLGNEILPKKVKETKVKAEPKPGVKLTTSESKLPIKGTKETLGDVVDRDLDRTNHRVTKSGVAVAEYKNPDTGEVDVIVGIPNSNSEDSYVAYKRIYENGKPTNKFSIKVDLGAPSKVGTKELMSEVGKNLPDGMELSESTSISTDGLTFWNNQIKNGYTPTGESVTIPMNAAGIKEVLETGTPKTDPFSNITFKTKEELEAARDKVQKLADKIPGAEVIVDKRGPIVARRIRVKIPILSKPKPTKQAPKTKQEAKDRAKQKIKEAREAKKKGEPVKEAKTKGPKVFKKQNAGEVDKLTKEAKSERQKTALGTVKNIIKALGSINPDIELLVHETEASYLEALGDKAKGTNGVLDTDGKIHLNLSRVESNTALHEAAHVVMAAYMKANPKAITDFKKQLEGILPKSDLESVNDFANEYEEDGQQEVDEEFVVEALSRIADGTIALDKTTLDKIKEFLRALAKKLGMVPNKIKLTGKEDVKAFAQKLTEAFTEGRVLNVKEDLEVLKPLEEQEQGGSGEVGTIKLRKNAKPAPSSKNDKRPFSNLVEDVDIKIYNGKKFITNMYDFTTAGEIDLGNNHKVTLFGGKNYVPLMMNLKGLKLGDVSNIAAFNTKDNAQGFIDSSVESGANLFMPHSGTIEGSWQFQHSIFEALTNLALTDKILSNKELIETFNEVLTSADGKKSFNAFKKKYKKSTGKSIENFDSFEKNPSELLELLDADNNYSPNLRKALNDKLSANKKFQEAIGVKNKSDFAKRMMDPMNEGVEGGELMGVIDFDNTTFEIKKTKEGDVDHHPSFGWTVLAKINGIFQPKEFHQSVDVTDSYTKYNKSGVVVSKRTDATERQYELAKKGKSIDPKTGKLTRDKKTGKLKKTKPFVGTFEEFVESKFDQSNVSSSAGSQPKVAKTKFQKSTDFTEKKEGERSLKGKDIVTGNPIRIDYLKNTEKAPDMGSLYGQDIEAKGDYITQSEGYNPNGWLTGKVEIKNPLVVEINEDADTTYKQDLSKKYDGKTGKQLSNAIKEDGHDAIVTKYSDDGTTGEIVLLENQRTKPKFQKSTSEDTKDTRAYIADLKNDGFLSDTSSEEILEDMADLGIDMDLEAVEALRNEALGVKPETKTETKTEEDVFNPKPKERRVTKNILKNPNISDQVKEGLSEDAKTYIPESNEITTLEARAIIEVKGLEQAKRDVLNFDNKMMPRVRVSLASQLIDIYNKSDVDSAVEIVNELSAYGTSLGQGIQAFSLWSKLSAEGMIKAHNNKLESLKADLRKKQARLHENVKKEHERKVEEAAAVAASKAVNSQSSKKKKEIKAFGMTKAEIKDKKKSALDKLKKAMKGGQTLTSGGFNSEMFEALGEYGAALFAEGVVNFKAWSAKMKRDTKITDDEALLDIWNNTTTGGSMTLKEMSEKGSMEQIAKEHFATKGTEADLSAKIQEVFNLSEDVSNTLASDMTKAFEKEVAKKKNKIIGKKGARIIDSLSEKRGLTDGEIDEAIAKEFGLESLPQETIDKLKELEEQRNELPEGFLKNEKTVEMLAEVEKNSKIPFKDHFWAVWYSSVLSGHETQILNVGANALNGALETFVSAVQKMKNPKDIGKLFVGLANGMMEGLDEAGQILSTGASPRKLATKLESSGTLEKVTYKGGKLNPINYYKYVGRLMNAMDGGANLANKGMMKQHIASDIARKEGLKGQKLNERVSELLNGSVTAAKEARKQAIIDVDIADKYRKEPMSKKEKKRLVRVRTNEILEESIPEEITEKAKDFAAFATFNYEPEGILGLVAKTLGFLGNEIPGGLFKFVAPFTGVVANVLNQQLDYTPYGYLRAMGIHAGSGLSIKNRFGEHKVTSRKAKGEWGREVIKATMGTLLMTGLYALASAYDDDEDPYFAISGKGPSDFKKRSQLMSTGWKPYSVKWGDTWIPYQYTPFGVGLALVGNMKDSEKYENLSEEDGLTKLGFGIMSVGSGIMDMSFLTGLSGLMSALTTTGSPEKTKEKLLKTIGRTGTSFIPNAFKQVDRAFNDATIYDTKTLRASVLSQIPIVKQFSGLKPKLNAFGQPISKTGNRFYTPVTKDPVWLLMSEKQAFAPSAGTEQKMEDGTFMTQDEYYEFVKISGQNVYKILEDDIDYYKGLTKAEFKKDLAKLYRIEKKFAKFDVYEIIK
jgi:hypothetical protein